MEKTILTLNVPTIVDYRITPAQFDPLFNLWSQVKNGNLDVTFDFSNCKFLPQSAVAFLGGLTRLIQKRQGLVRFALGTIKDKVKKNLAQNGFLSTLGFGFRPWSGNSIPYREDGFKKNRNVLVDYLKKEWLGRGWVHVSKPLRDAIVGKVWEIYANAFEHSDSPIGVFSCGQHYPRSLTLKLTVVDFGFGIPQNVRVFKMNPKITAKAALEWAFQRGTTTKPNGMGRGLGLDLLKNFVKVNKGQIEVFSHGGHALIDENIEIYSNLEVFFEGTLVNITFKCDESYYQLASEDTGEPLF